MLSSHVPWRTITIGSTAAALRERPRAHQLVDANGNEEADTAPYHRKWVPAAHIKRSRRITEQVDQARSHKHAPAKQNPKQ